ncbi:MAG: hypothetical protein AAGA55_01510 [Planctomycetota bacterium]
MRTSIALVIASSGLALAQPGSPAGDQPPIQPEPVTDAPPPEPRELAPEDRPDAEQLEAPPTDVSPAVAARLSAAFLTEEERADLRVRHGRWTDEDIQQPERLLRALAIAHAWNHPGFAPGEAPVDPTARTDAAESALHRGDPQRALRFTEGTDSPRALRVRARAHELLGDTDAATADYQRAAAASVETPDEPEVVRAALALLRLLGSPDAEQANRALLDRITRARDADRLNHAPRLVEAELLYARHNLSDAQAAAREALRLNPRAAGAWRLLGEIAVDSFDFDTAEAVAEQLDTLAATGTEHETAVSPDAAAVRARAALRRRDPAGAEMALAPALAAWPDRHELRTLEAAASAAAYDLNRTEQHLAEFDARSPGLPDALVMVGRTLSEARQYDLADGYLARAIGLAPFWSQPRLERGLMLVQAGRDRDARDELEQALSLDPFDLRAQNSLKLVTELLTYETIETEHFVVRFRPGIDAALAPEMAIALEAMHERVTSDQPGGSDHEPVVKTTIELMPNHEWFAVRIGGMPSIHTMAASTGPVIAIESPQIGPKFTVGPFDWPRVLQHEYTHTVNLSATKNRIIHWMTEANAVFNEDAPRDMRTWTLLATAYKADDLFDLEEINTAFVRPEKPSDRSLAYAQGAWMYEYIVERWGPDMPRTIMELSAAGRNATAAFEEALDETPESFLASFTPWAAAQLTDRGLLLPPGTPDVADLLSEALTRAGIEADPGSLPPEELIDELLAQHPDHPELLEYKIAFALVNADVRLTAEQLALLERMTELRPPDDAPHRRLARHYLAAGTFAERLGAIPHLEFLDAREINSPAYAAELAELYAKSDRARLAQHKAERASSIAPFDATLREQAARYALIAGDAEAAERHLVALIIIEPDRDIHQRRLDALMAKNPG